MEKNSVVWKRNLRNINRFYTYVINIRWYLTTWFEPLQGFEPNTIRYNRQLKLPGNEINIINGSEKMARAKTDFTNIKCCICDEGNLTSKTTYSECDEKGYRTGRWFCIGCYKKEEYKKGKTGANIINEMRDHRTNNLDPNCSSAKGDLFEELTSIWREIKRLSVENDNYRLPYDHSRDPELGIIDTKGSYFSKSTSYEWVFNTERECRKDVDNVICYCLSKDGKYIARIYIFPKIEFFRKKICIYDNPVRTVWYEKYRITDEDTIIKVNNIWKDIK